MSALKKNYENLVNAIVKQAVEDYQTGLLSDITSADRCYINECEEFFQSEFFQLLTNVDGKVIMEKAKKIVNDTNNKKLAELLSNSKPNNRIDKFRKLLPFIDAGMLIYLIKNDFFLAPASTRFHGAYEGGLFDHSYEMALTLLDLSVKNNLKWCRPESPMIIGMFHDICKMDSYIIEGSTIKHNPAIVDDEHGDKSIRILSDLIELTGEEIACIKYHMGAFTDKAYWDDYSSAIRRYPNVLWTHQADMIASQIKGV